MLIKLTKAFHCCYFILLCLIMVEVVWKMVEGEYFWGLFVVLGLALIYWAVNPLAGRWSKAVSYKWIWIGARLVSAAVMLAVAWNLKVELTWDWGYLLKSAAFYAKNDFAAQPSAYFAQYPNNCFWLYCLIWLYRAVGFFYKALDIDSFYNVSIVVSCLLIQLSIGYIYRTAKLIWGEKRALGVGVFALLCAPLYLYSGFLYTDSPGMLFGAMVLFYYLKLKREENWIKGLLYSLIVGALGALCYMTKVTVFIIFIALLVDMLFSIRDIGLRCFGMWILIVAFSIIGTWKSIDVLVKTEITITDEMQDRYEFPLTHWVMMGVGKIGGYSPEDVRFTYSFPSYQEKKKENVEEIKRRVESYGFGGMAKHIFVDKMKRTWCDSCMVGDDYISRVPMNDNSMLYQVLSKLGQEHRRFLQYSWAHYFVLILGMLLSGLRAIIRNDRQSLFVGRIAIFGIILFLSLWECNSRYLLAFLPVLILTGADGFYPPGNPSNL